MSASPPACATTASAFADRPPPLCVPGPAGRRARAPRRRRSRGSRPAGPRSGPPSGRCSTAGRSARAMRSSVTSASPTSPPASTNAGASTMPIGHEPDRAERRERRGARGGTATRPGTPALWAAGSASPTIWSAPRNTPASSTTAIGQTKPSGANRDSADDHADRDREVACAALALHAWILTGGMVRRPSRGFGVGEPGQEVGTGARVQHVRRARPRPVAPARRPSRGG